MDYAEFPDSTAVAWAGYDGARRIMRAAHRNSARIYEYKDVPLRAYRSLIAAPSKGTYINRFIKPNYDYNEVQRNGLKLKSGRRRSS